MKFLSTRGKCVVESSAYAITKGLADDGGLFVPETFPDLSNKLKDMLDMDYAERSANVLFPYLSEYGFDFLLDACKKAYSKFEDNDPAPVVKLDDKLFVLELFHGPTLAFKDIALTLLPHLLRRGADIVGIKQDILILVATSGDTGKAALSGFANQDGIKINVFYPSEGVSDMQKLQMQTTEGNNVNVVGVRGNFDDCQTAVKNIFSDKNAQKLLFDNNVVLSSANSINFGRLVPQIAYYFSAYLDLVNFGQIKLGDNINFVVPTGNFGNILAGYYAKQMGLPINKLICASNSNNVLTEFFASGDYNANREFFKTMSPSMDILVSSNLERLLFHMANNNPELIACRMKDLKEVKHYSISKEENANILKSFDSSYCEEDECLDVINNVFKEYGYVCDTHTSVALKSYFDFINKYDNKTVVLSTASPYKFPQSVYYSLSNKKISDAFIASNKLEELTAFPIPEQISELKKKDIRFKKVIEKSDTLKEVLAFSKQK